MLVKVAVALEAAHDALDPANGRVNRISAAVQINVLAQVTDEDSRTVATFVAPRKKVGQAHLKLRLGDEIGE